MMNGKLIRIPRPIRPPSSFSLSPQPKVKNLKLPTISKLSRTPKVDLNITQKVDLPVITRFNTPDPKREFNKVPNFISIHASPIDHHLINLEKIIHQEEKLWKICEYIDDDYQLIPTLSEYWEVSYDNSLWQLEKLFKDPRTRKLLHYSWVIESISICLMSIFCTYLGGSSSRLIQTKTMMNQVHQNFLTVIEMILSSLPNETQATAWVKSLQTTIQKKKFKTLKRAEYSTTLKHSCDIISNCIKTLAHNLPVNSNNLFNIMQVLSNIDKYSVMTARRYLNSLNIFTEFCEKIRKKDITLVLDLDETLVHYSGHKAPGMLLVRPYCEEFLKEMGEVFEVIIFTAGVQEYADWAIDLIDVGRVTKTRLYRQHTSFKSGSYVKDLSRLGKDLSRVIIVDNVQSNYQMQPENGIGIKSWVGDTEDTELIKMAKVLKDIASSKEDDVRIAIKQVNAKILL